MDKKPSRKPVQLDLKTFKKLEKICKAEKRGPGLQVAKLIDEEYERIMAHRRSAVDESKS